MLQARKRGARCRGLAVLTTWDRKTGREPDFSKSGLVKGSTEDREIQLT